MPQFPTPVVQRGRLYFSRKSIEAYKLALAGLPPKNTEGVVDTLVPAAQVSAELGFGRRTIGRRLVEARKTAERSEMGAAR